MKQTKLTKHLPTILVVALLFASGIAAGQTEPVIDDSEENACAEGQSEIGPGGVDPFTDEGVCADNPDTGAVPDPETLVPDPCTGATQEPLEEEGVCTPEEPPLAPSIKLMATTSGTKAPVDVKLVMELDNMDWSEVTGTAYLGKGSVVDIDSNTTYSITERATGSYTAWFRVSHPDGGVTEKTATFLVKNSAPVFKQITTKNVIVNQSISFVLEATDANEDAITYSLNGDATNAIGATLKAKTFSWKADASPGVYLASFIAKDANGASTVMDVPIEVKTKAAAAAEEEENSNVDPDSTTVAIKTLMNSAQRISMQDAGIGFATGSIVNFVDTDGDGDFDSIEDSANRISSLHDVESLDLLVLLDGETGNMVVFDSKTGKASEITQIPGSETNVQLGTLRGSEELPEDVTVTVSKEDGWIHVVIPDPAPGKDITSFERADGVDVELDQVWRDGSGNLHFIDDPDTTYTVGFETTSGGNAAWWIVLGILGFTLIVVGLVFAIRRYESSKNGVYWMHVSRQTA